MRKWRTVLTERLKDNPEEAKAYLQTALESHPVAH